MLNFFKNIKWWEYVYMGMCISVLIVLGVIFKSDWLVVLNSLLGMVALFLIAKGLVLGQIFGLIQLVTYCIMSYFNMYYGEIIMSVILSLPLYVLSIYTWTKHRKKENGVLEISQKIGLKEWFYLFGVVAVLSVGFYFLLEVLNTANLILSTLSASVGLVGAYLTVRRSEFNFVCKIITHLIAFGLWLSVLLSQITYLPTIVNYGIYICLDIFGIINWTRLKRLANDKPI